MMGLAEQMLASMSVDDVTETHSQKEEEHVVVNESRQIVVPNSLKTIAVTKDEDVQTITFDCVRFWDGNDLSTFAIYLNYVLPDGTPATYIPESVVTSDGDEFYHFEWKIKNNITQKSGKISIGITAIKTKVGEGGETVVDKRWSSLPNTDCSIALGIDVSDVPTEEESAGVVAQLTAILEKIQGDLDEWLTDNVVQTTGTSKSKVMSQEAVTIELEKEKNRSNSYVDKKYMELDNLIVRTSKRVENIEAGLQEESFVTDDSVEYKKNVPENALRYAELKSVGGMTYRDTATNTLKDSPVTAVKSVGANLIPYPYVSSSGTINGATATVNPDQSIAISGTPTAFSQFRIFIGSLTITADSTISAKGLRAGSVSIVLLVDGVEKYLSETSNSLSLSEGSTITVINVNIASTATGSNTIYPMLNKGTTSLPYTPYVERTLPIPEAVQALDGWGQGINATYNNHIAWSEDGTKKTYNKMVGVVDLGTLTWYIESSYAYSQSLASKAKSSAQCDSSALPAGVTEISIAASKNLVAYFTEGAYTDAETFKAAMSGVMLVYELAEPIVTDISDLITSDNLIGVEGGGTITFENEYGFAVPSEVEYQVEV